MLGGYVVEHSTVIAGVFEFRQARLIVHGCKAALLWCSHRAVGYFPGSNQPPPAS